MVEMESDARLAKLAGRTIVVKLGGSTLGNHDTALEDIAALHKAGVHIVVINGGGPAISSLLKRLESAGGEAPRFIRGLRVTDAATLDVVVMVLAGKVNKELVAALGHQAVGLCGVDGGILQARQQSEELGYVGEVTRVNPALLQMLLQSGYLPVVAPIGIAENGQMLNLNGDTAAGAIAAALQADALIFLTDVPGIRRADGSYLRHLTPSDAHTMMEDGSISGGMIPKVQACLHALDGAQRAVITDGRVEHMLVQELLEPEATGTTVSR